MWNDRGKTEKKMPQAWLRHWQDFCVSASAKAKNIITVADELEHARNYLMIQSLRAKDQFTYRIEKDPGTECFQVIKLIVQPIVENALYHGLEGMYGDGEIVIHAYTKDGDLYISVKDNGMGMSKEQAEALLDYTKELKTAKGKRHWCTKRTREDSAALWKRIRGTDHFRGR